jgi:hypothetical protein
MDVISDTVGSRNIARETAILIVSNLPFIFPAVVAGFMRMYSEALVYLFMTFISSFYHYLDQTGVSCIISTHICYSTLHFLDFVYAYSMIGLTTSIWLHHSSVGMNSVQMYKNRLYRNIVNTIVMLFLMLAIKDDLGQPILLGTLCGGLGVYSLVMIFYVGIDLRSINWWYTPFVLVFYGVSFTCFFLQDHNYWILHSVWHTCIAIGMGLTLMMRVRVPCRLRCLFGWFGRVGGTLLTSNEIPLSRVVPEFIPMGSDSEILSGPTGMAVNQDSREDPPYLMGTTGGSTCGSTSGSTVGLTSGQMEVSIGPLITEDVEGGGHMEVSIGPLMTEDVEGAGQKEILLW